PGSIASNHTSSGEPPVAPPGMPSPGNGLRVLTLPGTPASPDAPPSSVPGIAPIPLGGAMIPGAELRGPSAIPSLNDSQPALPGGIGANSIFPGGLGALSPLSPTDPARAPFGVQEPLHAGPTPSMTPVMPGPPGHGRVPSTPMNAATASPAD